MVLRFPNRKLRAYGGCLDSKEVMKDVTWRRYASGRCLVIFDPKMSEWGNPVAFAIIPQIMREIHPVK